ncbi:hypothetical protein D3I60_11145 [Brevibacterium permense]|uniref:hypothetical protein n=1 Tax=Brevibacterium permense TaxID=234834 RepID=UPI0021D0A6A1|nr:hypothetical protein [Brevibacterium permense]MCU4297629.1 hypothetical protein [Brevibacterium permense]
MSTTSDPAGRLVRPLLGRKYFNLMPTWTRGEWHWHWLLTSGQYINTSDPDMRKGYGWKIVGEAGPELVKLPWAK